MKSKTKTQTIVTEVEVGDVFQVIEDGVYDYYTKGHLLVVCDVSSASSYLPSMFVQTKDCDGRDAADYEWLSEGLSEGYLWYCGNVSSFGPGLHY